MDQDVSAIIVSHNMAPYIGYAIQSVLDQTHRPVELLVIDDSTDDTLQVVQPYVEKVPDLVKLVPHPRCNVSRSRNAGLERARGQFVAFLDADDLWLPDKTARQLAALAEHPDAVGASAWYFDFVNDLDDSGRRVPKPVEDDPDVAAIVLRQFMASSTVLMRRSAIGDLRFDEVAPHAEDTVFAAELRLCGPWRVVQEPLVAKRVHGGQASGPHWHQIRNVNTRLEWVRKNAARLGDEATRKIEDEMARYLIGFLEHRYWQRQMTDLKALCAQAAVMFPQAYRHSELSRRRLYPRWVYRLRDWMR